MLPEFSVPSFGSISVTSVSNASAMEPLSSADYGEEEDVVLRARAPVAH